MSAAEAKPKKKGRGAVGNRRAGHPMMLTGAVKAEQALELRLLGLPWKVIAERSGYVSAAGAYNAVMTLLARRPAPNIDAYRQITDARLHAAIFAIIQRVRAGDLDAVEAYGKLEDKIARLWGLYAPREVLPGGGLVPIQVRAIDYRLTLDAIAPLAEEAPGVEPIEAEYDALLDGDDQDGDDLPDDGLPSLAS